MQSIVVLFVMLLASESWGSTNDWQGNDSCSKQSRQGNWTDKACDLITVMISMQKV